MRKTITFTTLVAIGFSFILLLIPNGAFGQDSPLVERITIDPVAKFEVAPKSLCITEDKIFIIPDYHQGKVKIFSKERKSLKFIKALGPNSGEKVFMEPRHCFYSRNEGKLGVIDYKARRIFIFERTGNVEFMLLNNIECKAFGYDLEFAGDGEQLVVSGYLADKENKPFELYSINIRTGQINYLLPSHQKYGLKTFEDWVLEFRQKQTLPAIGIHAFFDIQGDDVYFVWEGALRVIKINLRSRETTAFNGRETPPYTRPDGSRLSESYKKGYFKTVWEEQKKMAYVRNIFVTSRYVFLVYETARSETSNTPRAYRVQKYTLEGDFLADKLIPGDPIWLDKERCELYTLLESSENVEKKFEILKYKIDR